jgi:hypothetical protein
MNKCWAACLGDCSDKISGEHIVTAGIFSTQKVHVQGFSWCMDAPKEIGLASAVKKVLCTEHNSRLSPVDEAVIQVFGALREAVRLNNVRSSLSVRRWQTAKFDVDGLKLERWCLKTLTTLSIGGSLALGPSSKDAETPDPYLVRVCFGMGRLQAPKGLYVAWAVGDKLEVQDEKVGISTFHDDRFLLGARFYLGGFQFLLYLNDRELKPGPLSFTHKDGSVEQRPQPQYHNRAVNFQIGKHVSHSVRFIWQ